MSDAIYFVMSCFFLFAFIGMSILAVVLLRFLVRVERDIDGLRDKLIIIDTEDSYVD